jgi:hypothetical protein
MKDQFNIILFLIIFLSSQVFAINSELNQRGEEYKEYPNWVDTPYDAASYILSNYDKLSKRDGYIKPLPIISDEEMNHIRNAKKIDDTSSKDNK